MVVACLAPTDLRPEVDPLTGAVRVDPRRADLSPAEAAALEYALRAADAWDGWVLAVAAGPAEIDPVLARAAAVGADALRVEWGAAHTMPAAVAGPVDVHPAELAGEPHDLAAALAGAITGRGTPALIVCGDRSGARGVGAVPGLLAHHLGMEQALGLVGLRIGPPARVGAQRRLDGGWREDLQLTGPVVVSVEAAGVRLRRAGLAGALAAESAPIPVVHPAPPRPGRAWDVRVGPARPYRPRTRPVPPPEGDTRQRLLSLTGALVSRQPPRIVGPLDPAGAADELLSYLERNGYRPADPTS